VFLTILNFTFFLIGSALFISAAIVKWDLLTKLDVNITEILKFKDLQIGEYLNTALIAFMCMGSFLIFISLGGFFGAICANKCLLYAYISVVILLFVAHLATLIFYLVKRPVFIKQVDRIIQNKAELLVSNSTLDADKALICVVFRAASDLLGCCGANGPQDFAGYSFTDSKENATVDVLEKCCISTENVTGCVEKADKLLNSADLIFITIPNIGLLAFEFILVMLVIALIKNINTKKQKQYLNNKYNTRNTYYEMRMSSSRPKNYYNKYN